MGRQAAWNARSGHQRRRGPDPVLVFSVVVLGAFVLAALLAPLLAPADYAAQDLSDRFAGPDLGGDRFQPLGADHLGRDLLSRLLYGARLSLAVGVSAVLIATLFGVPIGLLAGYAGGPFDLGLMWVMDLILAFPGLLLAIAIASALGPSPAHAALAIGLVGVPTMARLVRATALSAGTAPYVEAARALGSSLPHLLARHLLPAVAGVIVVRATFGLGAAILAEAGLSFLGLGAQPPDPSWGNLINDGRAYLRRAPSLTILPGLCIMATVLAFNLLGDALRDALDPQLP
jgi:peptide/nickel transport system permease protein